jgi:hypothetical protein
VEQQTGDAQWGAHAQAILDGGMWQAPRAGGHDDKAHPPIHPTRYYSASENGWSPGTCLCVCVCACVCVHVCVCMCVCVSRPGAGVQAVLARTR